MYIKINELEAINLAASKDDTRYYLKGVLIETYKDGKQGMIATDGHRLASLYMQPAEEVASSYILSTDDAKKIILYGKAESKSIPKNSTDFIAVDIATDDKASLTVYIGLFEKTGELVKILNSFTTKAIDGTYPDWRRTIPQQRDAISGGFEFNADYMADFGKMAKLLTGLKTPCICVKMLGDYRTPLKIEIADCPNFAGVLMPMVNKKIEFLEFKKVEE